VDLQALDLLKVEAVRVEFLQILRQLLLGPLTQLQLAVVGLLVLLVLHHQWRLFLLLMGVMVLLEVLEVLLEMDLLVAHLLVEIKLVVVVAELVRQVETVLKV
jgi:hypothetical protein